MGCIGLATALRSLVSSQFRRPLEKKNIGMFLIKNTHNLEKFVDQVCCLKGSLILVRYKTRDMKNKFFIEFVSGEG